MSVCEVFAVDGRVAGRDVVLVEHVGQRTGLSLERRGWGCADGVTTHRQVLFIRGDSLSEVETMPMLATPWLWGRCYFTPDRLNNHTTVKINKMCRECILEITDFTILRIYDALLT